MSESPQPQASSARTLAIFPDTNLFLEGKALQELPWKDAFTAQEIHLLVAAPVQNELDRFKRDVNRRRARRARSLNSLFGKLLESAEQVVVVRDAGPRVLLMFAPQMPPERITPSTLDLKVPDDQLEPISKSF